MLSAELDLAAVDLARRLAAGADVPTALETANGIAADAARAADAAALAAAQQRLSDAAADAVRGSGTGG